VSRDPNVESQRAARTPPDGSDEDPGAV
jgi:hypothetical protein